MSLQGGDGGGEEGVVGGEAGVVGLDVFDGGLVALDGGEGDGAVEGGVEAVEVVEEMREFALEGGELDEAELLLLRTDVVDDLQVHLLQDQVQLVQDLLLHLVEDVLAHFNH